MKSNCISVAVLIFFMAFLSIGCGSSGGGGSDSGPSTSDEDGSDSDDSTHVSSLLSLSLSQISVKSDNSDSSTITASVLDINNVPIEGIRVTFSSTGGQISVSSVLTDVSGEAKIIFKSGTVEKKNQTVNITASVADLNPKMIPIQITGTTVTLFTNNTNLEIDPNNPDKAKTSLIITVNDAGNLPIFDAPVTIIIESESTATAILVLPNGDTNGSTLTGNTDVNGTLTVEITGTGVGDLKIAAEALGYTATQTYVVGAIGEIFSIVEPLEDIVSLSTGTPLTITVKAPDSGPEYDNVSFATTFGTWDGGTDTVVTKLRDADNKVSASLSSANAGFATVQVYYTNEDSHSTKDSLTVAISAPSSEAAKIALQASSTVVAPRTGDTGNTVTLWAKVRNADDQVVGGAPVAFLIENPTGGGETISPTVVFTNEYGIAETTFTSGSLSSDAQGVTLKASVVGMPAIDPASISIIIGGTASSVVIGQSSEIKSVNEDTAYQLPMSVLVVDSNGNSVSNSQVTLGAWPKRYATGYWIEIDDDVCIPTGSRTEILNEDTNMNSIKDPGEDANDDGELTPSHSAAGSVPSIVVTDNNGVAQFDLIYLKSSAGWIEDSITASTVVYGTETQSTYTFWLPWAENESCNLSDSPYGTISEVGLISIQAESSNIVADGTSTTLITATVKNSNGTNVEDGITVTFTITAGSLNTYTPTTTNGIATATLTSSNNLGTATITATAGGVSNTTTVSFVPGAVDTIVLTASPNNLTADGSSSSTIRAVVTDVNDNLIVGEAISFTVTGDCGGTISSATAITNSGGVATIIYTSSETTGTDTITAASVNGTTNNVDIELITASVGSVSISAGSESIKADGVSQTVISATVLDVNGDNIVDGTDVTFTTTAGDIDNVNAGTQSTVTNPTANGVATVTLTSSNNLGTATITATAGGVSDTTTVSFVPGAVNTIVLTASPNNLTADGSSTSTIRAVVTDANNNLIVGEAISFTVTGDCGGIISSATAMTNSGGVATIVYTSSETDGTDTITAASVNGTTDDVDIRLITASVDSVSISAGSASIVADGSQTQITAIVQDANGNNVVDDTEVTFTTTAGSLNIDTPTITTAKTTNGVASATLTSSDNIGTATVTATAGGVSDTTTVSFVPGAVETIVLSASPNNLTADGVSTSTIRAVVTDGQGNPVGFGETISFSVTTGTGTLSAATANTNSSGIATVIYTSSETDGPETITAISANGTIPADDLTITLIPEQVGAINLSLGSSSLVANGENSTLITATVTNLHGKSVIDDTDITFTTTGGDIDNADDVILGPQTEVITKTTNGVATAILCAGTDAGQCIITATGGSISQLASIEFVSGAAADIPTTLSANPTVIDADGASTSLITATVFNKYDKPVADGTTVNFYTTAGDLSSASSTTANGVATATLTSSTTNETATVTAIVNGVSKTTEVTFGVGPGTGEPVFIIIAVDPENIQVKGTGGIESVVIKASVKDENNEPYNDNENNIKFEILSGPGGGEALNSGDGIPGVSKIISTKSGIATVSLNSGAIAGTVRVKVTVLKDAAGNDLASPLEAVSTQIGIEAGDPFNITLYKASSVIDNEDGSISWIISALVQDQYGNPVSNDTGVYFGLVDNQATGCKSFGDKGMTNNDSTFTSAGTNFLSDGVIQFDTLIILEGQDEGGHIIDTPGDGTVTLLYNLMGTESGLDFVAGNAELGTICGVVPTGNLEPDATCTPSSGTAIKGVAHTRLTWGEPAMFKPFYLYAETEGRNLGKTFGKPYSYPGIEPVAIDVTLDPASVFAGTKSITVNAHFHDGATPPHDIREEELTFTTDNTIISGFGAIGTDLAIVTTNDNGFAVSNLVTDTNNCIDSEKEVIISVSHGQYVGTATLTILATAPTANFSSTDAGDSDHVFFVDSSTTVAGTSITAWNWDFNNDSVSDSTNQSPQYSFGSAGNYAVTLTVTNDFGCTDSLTGIVTVP